VNHRTDKSTVIHHFKRYKGWEEAVVNFEPFMLKDRISTANESRFRESLNESLERNTPIVKRWFSNNQRIEQNIRGLINDIENVAPEFAQRTISHEYLLGFLNAQIGDFEKTEGWINTHFKNRLVEPEDETEMNLLLGRIQKMKTEFDSK